MKTKISQSLIKEWMKIKWNQQCPKVFFHKYIKGDFPDETTDSQHLGCFFEYQVTGAKMRNGDIPEPKTLKSGKLAIDYQRAMDNSERAKATLEHHGFVIEETDVTLETDIMKGKLDIIGTRNGKPCVIDLKYSGAIGDKWNDFGWHDDNIHEKFTHTVQAIHYSILFHEVRGVSPDFFFVVFPSKNTNDGVIYQMKMDMDIISRHMGMVHGIMDELEHRTSFDPEGSFLKCAKCPFKEDCEGAVLHPEIKVVDIE